MKGERRHRRRRGARRVLLVLVLLCLLLAFLLVDGQRRLVTEEFLCPIKDLPGSFEGFRIVQLSDLHGASFGEGNRRLLRAVEAAEPDIIALTGDFVEKEADLLVTGGLLRRLAKIAPCYYVSGNHEWASGCMSALEEQLVMAGVTCLHNEYISLARGGEEIMLCGVEDPNSWADLLPPDELIEQLRTQWSEGPVVLLGHRNYWVEEYPELDVDLILCGHGHGGVLRLPFVGGILGTSRQLFPEYDAGRYESGSYTMLVSRGLGNTFGFPRFLNNPQLLVAVLEKEA